ncbi:MAG TPA: hypothetical protein VFB49_00630 [Patescibacteria group bacterium]|nr:hypothetical protein [Patescibacteria group bacterium]
MIFIIIGLLCALSGTALAAADPPDLSLSAILAGAQERPAGAAMPPEGPAAVLASMAGTDAFTVGCASPILIAGAHESAPAEALRQALGLLAAPPLAADAPIFVTRDGRFALRYAAPGAPGREREVNPEIVARIAEALVAARSYVSATLGYADPSPAPAQVSVYLVRLGHGLEGYIVPARAIEAGRTAPAFIVLDAGIQSDRIMPAILHQVAHLSLLRMADPETWWQEATASLVTLMGAGDMEDQRAALGARLGSQARGLLADDLVLMQGALLWPLFLSERTGDPDVVRRIWVAMAGGISDPMQAADVVLAREGGLPAGAAFREMALWTLFTGERDDGAHFSAARAMPAAAMETVGPSLPLQAGRIDPVEPLGSVALRLPAERASGSLDLELQSRGGRPAADILIFYQSEGGRPVLVPVDLTQGSARLSLPWGQAREAWIVLRNEARAADAGATTFEVHGTLDASAPFDLASLTAEPVGRTVVLSWTTASEKGLVGWNLYRSDDPSGPFTRLNDVAVPAYGDSESDTGYLYVDDKARSGRRYYYLVEGINSLGLVERSHVASARTLPAR